VAECVMATAGRLSIRVFKRGGKDLSHERREEKNAFHQRKKRTTGVHTQALGQNLEGTKT